MLPILFGLGATAISAMSATAEAAIIGASVGAATALATNALKQRQQPPAPLPFMNERMVGFDEAAFEAAFKQALRIAYQHQRPQYPMIEQRDVSH